MCVPVLAMEIAEGATIGFGGRVILLIALRRLGVVMGVSQVLGDFSLVLFVERCVAALLLLFPGAPPPDRPHLEPLQLIETAPVSYDSGI